LAIFIILPVYIVKGKKSRNSEYYGYNLTRKELQEKLYNLDWKKILTKLYAYTYARRKYHGLPDSITPEEIVNEVVSKVLSGERNWDDIKYPDILVYLKMIIKSAISHEWEKEHIREQYKNELIAKRKDNLQQITVNNFCTEIIFKEALEEIEEILRDDDNLLLIFYAMQEGYTNDMDLSEVLEINIKDIRNIKKRMRRKIEEIGIKLGLRCEK